MKYAIRYRRCEPWQGTRWIVEGDGRTLAKGWAWPDGRIELTFGTCPEGATDEIAARFAPAEPAKAETVVDEEE